MYEQIHKELKSHVPFTIFGAITGIMIQETGANAKRIKAKNCIDMLADIEQRKKISGGKKIYWLSSGWLKFWKQIFKDWDIGLANETFPQNDKAIILDSLDIFSEYSEQYPE